MISCSRGLFSGLVLMAMACGPNAGGLGSADAGQLGSDSGTAGGTTDMTTPAPTATVTATTNGNGNGTGTTGTAESSSGATTVPGSTSMSESSSGDSPPGSSSTGEPPEATYPACADENPVCPEDYDECFNFPPPYDFYNLCTVHCNNPGQCPDTTSGTAIPVCIAQVGDLCLLNCAGGLICPSGMACETLDFGGGFVVDRCVWTTL